jgi:hypothetical protein
MNEAGNDVHLQGNNPHIKNVKTGQTTKLRKQGRCYLLDLWIWVPAMKAHNCKTSLFRGR